MKNKSRILILFLVAFVCFVPFANAQTIMQDVVYLKDGSVYKGIIREQSPDMVKIEISGGSIIAISKEKIDKVATESITHGSGSMFIQKRFGYFNITEIGIPVGSEYEYYYYNIKLGFTAQSIHGYRFYTNFLAGAGIGIDVMDHPMFHLFADLRYEPLKHQTTPFFFIQTGYSFDLAEDPENDWETIEYKGGYSWGSGIGMRVNFKSAGAFVFSAGFKSTKRSEHIFYDYDVDVLEKFTMNRLSINMGLSF